MREPLESRAQNEIVAPSTPLVFRDPELPSNEICFNLGRDKAVLRLTENGFIYKDQLVEDAGEAHRLFMEWLREAKRQ